MDSSAAMSREKRACALCGRSDRPIPSALPACAACLRADSPAAREVADRAHREAREAFGLPGAVPAAPGGSRCRICANACEIPEGSKNCVPINGVKPDNECLACLPDQSQTSWSPRPPSTGCDDEDACTIGDHCENGECKGTPLKCEAWNPTCSEGDCYCDLGPPPVQCDGDIADTCYGGTCKCGTNPACVPTSKNPTCVSGTCQCGTTVCDDRSDRCVAGACKCGNLDPCDDGKVCCDGTCCATGKKCCPDLTCKVSC